MKRELPMHGDVLDAYVRTNKSLSPASEKARFRLGSATMFYENIFIGDECTECKSAEEITKIFDSEGITPDKNAVFSCVSGCFGTVLYFRARLLDFQKAAVYDGGWIEWSRKDYPIEAGSDSKAAGEIQKPPVKATPPASAPRVPDQGC